MTKIQTLTFEPKAVTSLKNVAYTKDWPVVYLLENGKEIYIGETTSAHSRLSQHLKNEKRVRLTQAHILIDEQYNKSAALDTESWLIEYMAADDKFILQNANKGISNHSYYDREKYRAKFEVLWSDMQSRDLAKKDLIQLRNSDVFKYSPYKALTAEQLLIVERIQRDLADGIYKTYVINGDPGTGKSVLATYLAKFLADSDEVKDLKIGLVVSMTSLRSTLQKVFRKVKGLDASMVIAPNKVMGKQYDLLIVDEAHRLRQRKNLSGYVPFDNANAHYGLGKSGNQLDWMLRASKSLVLLYDKNQTVMPGDIPGQLIDALDAEHHHLTSQLRVIGGVDYINFVDDLLNLRTPKTAAFHGYDLRYFNSAKDLFEAIQSRDQEAGLSRTVAGYAWDWKTKKNGEPVDFSLDGMDFIWNSTATDWVNSPNAVNEVGCIHTVQGYDLNYVGVIIGPELQYDEINRKLIVDKAKYRDINGKRGMESPEELDRYILNIYKTLLTRGIKGTYLHAVDDGLAKYIRTIIERGALKQIISNSNNGEIAI